MVLPGRVLFFADCRRKIMENKGKKKSSSRNDISLDQAILQWIVDDYDISDEKSGKIVGKSGEKSKLITCKMVMNYLDNGGVLEETADGRAFLEPSPGAAEHSGFPVCPVAG